jgi:hypothetical protein
MSVKTLTPYRDGFHKAVIGAPIDENPYAVHTVSAFEWDEGWSNYKQKKKRLEWKKDPLGHMQLNEKSEWGFLCLVKDHDGFYSHIPLIPGPIRELGEFKTWVTCKQKIPVVGVVEWAIIPINTYLSHPVMQPGAY